MAFLKCVRHSPTWLQEQELQKHFLTVLWGLFLQAGAALSQWLKNLKHNHQLIAGVIVSEFMSKRCKRPGLFLPPHKSLMSVLSKPSRSSSFEADLCQHMGNPCRFSRFWRLSKSSCLHRLARQKSYLKCSCKKSPKRKQTWINLQQQRWPAD